MKHWLFGFGGLVGLAGLAGLASLFTLATLVTPNSGVASDLELGVVCNNPAKAFCADVEADRAEFIHRSVRVWSAFVKRMGLTGSQLRDWRKTLKLNSQEKSAPVVLEQETLKVAGITREEIQQEFENVQDAFLETVQSHTELPQRWRDEMLSRITRVQLVLPSEADRGWDPVCGKFGLDTNAFAFSDPQDHNRQKVVLCPGMLLLGSPRPEVSSIDYVLAHELGHHIDSLTFSAIDGHPVFPYYGYVNCLRGTLGLPLRDDQLRETTADFWGAEVFARLNLTKSPQDVAKELSANALFLCTRDLSDRKRGRENWGDVHLPSSPRMSQAMIYDPAIHQLLGCQAFTPVNPGCNLSGIYPSK